MTPYEKNIEFWRQLWRVVEKSDVVVQIVDARNPLLYYSSDLDRYVHEVDPDKIPIVLVNKSDLLSEQQRTRWANYFSSINVRPIFWSALHEAPSTIASSPSLPTEDDSADVTLSDPGNDSDSTLSADQDNDDEYHSAESGRASSYDAESPDEPDPSTLQSADVEKSNLSGEPTSPVEQNCDVSLLTPNQLLDLLSGIGRTSKSDAQSMITIGFIGYPNVGKSSTMNALFGAKKTPVSATPGRTKHFQTLIVRPGSLQLCDCPGLVMPSFVHSKADLVVSGVLPIDEMRDCITPVSLICQRIHRRSLELMYGIKLPNCTECGDEKKAAGEPTPHQLLCAHALSHGFRTSNGNPHYDRSARLILKDYVNGRLLYCHPPPDLDPDAFQLLGRPRDGLPPTLALLDAGKRQRLLQQLEISNRSQSTTVTSDGDDSTSTIMTDFDRMTFSSLVQPTSHIASKKQLVISTVSDQIEPRSHGDSDDDDTASTASWSTVATDASSCYSSIFNASISATRSGHSRNKPWRVVSNSKRTDLPPGFGGRKRKEKLRRVYAKLDQHETV